MSEPDHRPDRPDRPASSPGRPGPASPGRSADLDQPAPAAPSRRPGRLGVGVVSAGKVGAVLGSALRAVDHQVIGVHAVSQASRERAETLLPGVPRLE